MLVSFIGPRSPQRDDPSDAAARGINDGDVQTADQPGRVKPPLPALARACKAPDVVPLEQLPTIDEVEPIFLEVRDPLAFVPFKFHAVPTQPFIPETLHA